VLIELTDPGRAAAAVITRTLTDLENQALKDLPAEAIAGFRAVLGALIREGS
jgi:DNA-binding MarR family transcriptional regulator